MMFSCLRIWRVSPESREEDPDKTLSRLGGLCCIVMPVMPPFIVLFALRWNTPPQGPLGSLGVPVLLGGMLTGVARRLGGRLLSALSMLPCEPGRVLSWDPGRVAPASDLMRIAHGSMAGCGDRARIRAGDAVPTGFVPWRDSGRGQADSRGAVVFCNASVMISWPRICRIALFMFLSVTAVGFKVQSWLKSTEGPRPLQGTR
jgi:hypothetical protein